MQTNFHSYSDKELLSAIAGGDSNAFTELYNRYWDKLLFIAGAKFRDLSVAEEMVQDIFLDIWNRRSTLQINGNLEAYLAVSMKYKVINAQARLKRTAEFRQYLEYHQTEQDNSTEEWISFHELKERLSVYVSKLPERCRITYQLSKELGFSQKEIAAHLEISEKAVEANLSRAMKSMRIAINQIRLFSFFFL